MFGCSGERAEHFVACSIHFSSLFGEQCSRTLLRKLCTRRGPSRKKWWGGPANPGVYDTSVHCSDTTVRLFGVVRLFDCSESRIRNVRLCSALFGVFVFGSVRVRLNGERTSFVECQCRMPMSNANVECQCRMPMLNANVECQC